MLSAAYFTFVYLISHPASTPPPPPPPNQKNPHTNTNTNTKRFTFNFLGTSLHLGFFDLHVFWTFQLNFMLVCCLSILSLGSLPPTPKACFAYKTFLPYLISHPVFRLQEEPVFLSSWMLVEWMHRSHKNY